MTHTWHSLPDAPVALAVKSTDFSFLPFSIGMYSSLAFVGKSCQSWHVCEFLDSIANCAFS